MKILLLILAITLLTIGNTQANNSVNIADDFMMKINLDNFRVVRFPLAHRNFTFHSIDNPACIASTFSTEDPIPTTELETFFPRLDGANGILFKDCDTNDITQRFTYANKNIKNYLGQCLTEIDIPSSLRVAACDFPNGRILDRSIRYRESLLFSSCDGSGSQEWDLDTSSGNSISFHKGNRCPTFTGESLARRNTCGSLGTRNTVVDSFFVGVESCSLRGQTHFIENPEGGQVILERIVPIVIPL